VPLQEVAKARADAQRTLWLATLAVLAVGALVVWLLSASLTRRLERLTKAAGRVARLVSHRIRLTLD
jgi:HAMP domain-containing protein